MGHALVFDWSRIENIRSHKKIFQVICIFFSMLTSSHAKEFLPQDPNVSISEVANKGADRKNLFQRKISVLSFSNVDNTGNTDSALGIQQAIDQFAKINSVTQNGGLVYFPAGKYKISRSLDLTGKSGVKLVGETRLGTVLIPTGNFPAIIDKGKFDSVDNHIGVESMWIQCAGMTGSLAHGISFTYVNHGELRDLLLTGCNHALDLYDQWQTTVEDIRIDGEGSQKNAIGVYLGAPTNITDPMPNNAIQASNITVKSVAQYGFRLVYFAGSKFINSEANNGVYGWFLCGEAFLNASLPCQFGHFVNVLGDSTIDSSWFVDQGENKNKVTDLMFSNVWAGNSHKVAFRMSGVENTNVEGLHIASADEGLYIKNSNNIKVSALINNYNRSNSNAYAVVLDKTNNSFINALAHTSQEVSGYNGFREMNESRNNQVFGGLSACSIYIAFGKSREKNIYKAQFCQYEIKGQEVSLQFLFNIKAPKGRGVMELFGLPSLDRNFNTTRGLWLGTTSVAEFDRNFSTPVTFKVAPETNSIHMYIPGSNGLHAIQRESFSGEVQLSGLIHYFKE